MPRGVLLMLGVMCVVVFTLCALAVSSHAVVTFEKTYGGTYYEDARCVRQTSDGGYVVAGWTYSYGAGSSDWYIVRTDSLGNTVWERVFGLGFLDHCWSVLEAGSGGFVASGEMAPHEGQSGYGLLKLDSSGDSLWAKNHGIMTYRGCVRGVSDGGYIMVGASPGVWTGDDLCLVKTDSLGELIWTRRYGGSASDIGHDVCETSDAGFIATGETRSFSSSPDIYMVRTTASGDMIWEKAYGGSETDRGYSVAQSPDGGFLVAGYTRSSGAGEGDAYLLKTNSLGDSLWARTYGGPMGDDAVSHQSTSDGGFIMTGGTRSFGAGLADVFLLKLDSLGSTIWTRTYGGTGSDRGNFVRQTSDGGYVITGATNSSGAGEYDVYLIKTDQYGRVQGCDPVEPWEPRTQGYWRRQCKSNPHEDICAYVDSVHVLSNLFGTFDCDSVCDLLDVDPPERDMCRKARRQYMALLLNIASGKLAVCNCLEDGREVGDVIGEIDSLLSEDPDFHTCEYAKTLADEINNGIGIVPCDTVWVQAPSKTFEPSHLSVVPNPFATSTIIGYELKTSKSVRLEVFDKAGRLMQTLIGTQQPRGFHRVRWDGFCESGREASAGVYFLRLQIGHNVGQSKVILLR